jgi:hypothetical protein
MAQEFILQSRLSLILHPPEPQIRACAFRRRQMNILNQLLFQGENVNQLFNLSRQLYGMMRLAITENYLIRCRQGSGPPQHVVLRLSVCVAELTTN